MGIENVLPIERYKLDLPFTALNLTNNVALDNFLSTFSETHFVTAEIGPDTAHVEFRTKQKKTPQIIFVREVFRQCPTRGITCGSSDPQVWLYLGSTVQPSNHRESIKDKTHYNSGDATPFWAALYRASSN